jgi:L-arabinose isomerase
MNTLHKRDLKPVCKIGLLPVGHSYYWDQFPELKSMGERMFGKALKNFEQIGEVRTVELVDTMEKAQKANKYFLNEGIDIIFIFPVGYTPSMNMVPAVHNLNVPIRILNAHEDSSYDYTKADTTMYLHHEGVCCVPEISGALVNLGRMFKVLTGHFGSGRLWSDIRSDCTGAAAARMFRSINIGLIGETYTHMSDMPIDEHRLIRATGKLLVRPEVEEIEEAYYRVTDRQLEEMYVEIRDLYDVDSTVTNEHMKESARIAIAYDEVIRKRHDIDAFGYYWWGEKDLITQLRSQSNIAVSRLSALGCPGVTEGDVKSAMGLKIFDLLGTDAMFVEFFSMDFDEGFFMMGHDGPSNINVAEGKARLQHLAIHHGKSGFGLGIDFEIRKGPVTLMNLTQFNSGDTFKLIYSVGEAISGDILSIGNPNCRVRVNKPLDEFMNMWCQQGPSHHIALGVGDYSSEIETFAEAMGFICIKI